MLIRPDDIPSIQKHFQELRAELISLTSKVARAGAGDTILKEISGITQKLVGLEQSVTENLKKGDSKLGALIGVGRTINSSLGLNRVLEEVLDSLISLMRAERGFLMLKDSQGALTVRIARGIAHVNLNEASFSVSRTIIDQVAATGETVLTTNAKTDPRFEMQDSVAIYQLRSILCAPLKLKDDLLGVIYVDNRAQVGRFQEHDKDLITAFSDQAAVAIDNAQLFDSLQLKNRELEEAYQATLEGWVSALDLRDKETEGHTQRVTLLTQRLAREMGVSDEELIHVTRGALLHDIGKMAIPDGILLKPAKLTDEEREMMEQHPSIAYNMLKRIEFLLPAIDIPYCHHEKWDGSGYPRKLSGEDIPFVARLFSIVDVWDALTSDRPYRKRMPVEEALGHIKSQSGKHFDPQVVEVFVGLEEISD